RQSRLPATEGRVLGSQGQVKRIQHLHAQCEGGRGKRGGRSVDYGTSGNRVNRDGGFLSALEQHTNRGVANEWVPRDGVHDRVSPRGIEERVDPSLDDGRQGRVTVKQVFEGGPAGRRRLLDDHGMMARAEEDLPVRERVPRGLAQRRGIAGAEAY